MSSQSRFRFVAIQAAVLVIGFTWYASRTFAGPECQNVDCELVGSHCDGGCTNPNSETCGCHFTKYDEFHRPIECDCEEVSIGF